MSALSIEVRWFASLVERSGCATEQVELPAGSDVAALWAQLVRRHPPLAECGFRPLVACDRVYSAWDRSLEGVREVAFLPPVSGG